MFFHSMIQYKKNKQTLGSPVRIVWKASSTLDESNADVSRKDKPCFSVKNKIHIIPKLYVYKTDSALTMQWV